MQITEISYLFFDKPLHNLNIELPAPPKINYDIKKIKFILIEIKIMVLILNLYY